MPTLDSDAAGNMPARGIERLRPDGLAMDEVGVARVARMANA